MNKVAIAEKTQKPESIRGGGGMGFVDYETDCLVPVAKGILSPADGVTITNIGFIDNKLHIQIYFGKNRTKGNWQVTFPLENAEYTSKDVKCSGNI